MDVSLKPQVQKLVGQHATAGRFRLSDEVLEETLVRMIQLDDETLAAIDRYAEILLHSSNPSESGSVSGVSEK
jgi:hypothetical protein